METPSPPDINKDRICVIYGATLITICDVMVNIVDSASVWVTRINTEDYAHQKEAREKGHPVYPREDHFRVSHEMRIGTVEELVEDFREGLTRCFNAFTLKDEGGVIPTFGERSLRKQTEVFERNGIKEFSKVPQAPHDIVEAFVKEQNAITLYEPRQSFYERNELKSAVAMGRGKGSPSDNPVAIQELIDALVILRDDRYRGDDIYYAMAWGVNPDTISELLKRFNQRHGKVPTRLILTGQQILELGVQSGQYMGMDVVSGKQGPILE